jgi:hypothetical protein
VSDEHLLRVSQILRERAIPPTRLLGVIDAVGVDNVYLGVNTLTERVQLLVPFVPGALSAVGLDHVTTQGTRLQISAQGDRLTAAAMISGAVSRREAVEDVGPADGRADWLAAVESLTGGTIGNRMRYLTEERGAITIMFPPRTGGSETTFVRELSDLATRLGVPARWHSAYAEAGEGAADIGVTTECTAAGPAPRLALRSGGTVWDRAIDLAKSIVDVDQARDAAVRMGMLAGTLGIDTIRSVELVFDRAELDLICWVKLT